MDPAQKIDWQGLGGRLEIPDGWFVSHANFDLEEPIITISQNVVGIKDRELRVPKALAYYLSVHFCGSEFMRDLLRNQGKEGIRCKIRSALGL